MFEEIYLYIYNAKLCQQNPRRKCKTFFNSASYSKHFDYRLQWIIIVNKRVQKILLNIHAQNLKIMILYKFW